jgi:elongation factor Ts
LAIDARTVKDLRDRTGAGMMECKKALEDAAGDLEKASELLRARGLAKAAKKAGRETKEGLIFSRIAEGAKAGSLLELSCETDFVANNENFRTLGADLVGLLLAGRANGPVSEFGDEIGERVQALIARLGENVQIRRAARFAAADGHGAIFSYVHAGDKIGVLLELAADKDAALTSDAFRGLGKELCMQVAALGPRFISDEELPKDQRERQLTVFRDEAIRLGKPANVAEKIAAGRLSKELEAVCLLDQAYIRDEAVKVKDLVAREGQKASAKLTVRRFVRYQIGETLD